MGGKKCNNFNKEIIGVPKEIKNNESRVALTPAGAREFIRRNHRIYTETNAISELCSCRQP